MFFHRVGFFAYVLGSFLPFSSVSATPEAGKYASIQQAILDQEFRTLPDFLAWVQQSDAELMSGWTLMYRSGSLQSASYAKPRAIVFGTDGRFMMTFNADVGQRGGDRVEMIQFNAESATFEFRELVFSAGAPQLSAANPEKCVRCHTSQLRPIWEKYDNWPGAFGEDDDALIDFAESRYAPTHLGSEKIRLHTEQRQQFLAFVAGKDEHPRYRYLKVPEGTKSSVAPYSDHSRTGQFPLRPNLQLTKLIGAMNGAKVAAQLQAHARGSEQCFAKVAPLVVALAMNCGFQDRELENQWWEYRKGLTNVPALAPLAAQQVTWTRYSSNPPGRELATIMTYLGGSLDQWNVGQKQTSWAYFLGFNYLADEVLLNLFPRLQKVLPGLPSYRKILAIKYPDYYGESRGSYGSYGSTDGDSYSNDDEANRSSEYPYTPEPFPITVACDLAVRASLKLTNDDYTDCLQTESPAVEVSRTVAMCMSCHAGTDAENRAPRLALSAPEGMSLAAKRAILERIDRSHGTPGAMPPDRELGYWEKAALRKWFQ